VRQNRVTGGVTSEASEKEKEKALLLLLVCLR
jgi:hypothetical protein